MENLKSIIIVIELLVIHMATTVQVDEKTLQMLNITKKEMKAKSHNEVIRKLLLKHRKTPRSMFGSNPKLDSFTAEDEADFHEL
jgi:hypothetical protein